MGYKPWGRKESDMTEQLHSLRTKDKIVISVLLTSISSK